MVTQTMVTLYRNHGYEVFSYSNHGITRVRQPIPALFPVQMQPPAAESLYFKAFGTLSYSLHRILSLVSGFVCLADLIQ